MNELARHRETPLDPVTQEILQGKLLAVVDEMGIVLARCSMSPVVYEVLDFACGICTVAGDLVAQTNGITLFTGTFSAQVRALHNRFAATMAPGDVFITNDPYRGGTHGCDFAVVRPIYDGDAHVGYAITVAHWLDVGGTVPGSLPADATTIFQEGLRLPGVRVMRGDQLVDDIVAIIRENVRLPELALGDLNAQLAAARIAEKRVQEICTKYGRTTLMVVFDGILAASERLARAAVRALPDGCYKASDFIDGDGRTDERIPIQLTVTIAGDEMIFDYTGSSPARAAPINCSRGALHSAVKTIFKAMVTPQAPSNDGWFRPVQVVVPDGTVFSAVKPSPTGWYYEGSAQASELAWKALAPIAPERFSAGSYTSLCATYFCGTLPDGNEFVHIEPQHGGWGATSYRDGASALIAVTDGDTFNYPAELLEAKFPLRIVRHALNIEGGAGAGQWRGGFGVIREYEVLAAGTYLYASFGRSATRPWGLAGGREGSLNYIEVQRPDGTQVRLSRTAYHPLHAGDRVRLVTGGGGGWGSPQDRPAARVRDDIANGYLDPATAASDYGSVARSPEPTSAA
ncbi:MAG: hydantoinase B/oxoprolinase family protein [Burkholderiales bacterium]|nr:hydantoinase B/oxoprolinase family protein [Burkholderiales bacterium]